MKGEHRHDLETNALAKRLAAVIERSQSYGPTILGVTVAVVACLMVFSYLSSSSTARQGEAWSAYISALEGPIANDQIFNESMRTLKESAEEHAGTSMQLWSDITWADGQVWYAARIYTLRRSAAIEAMDGAASVYQSLLQSTEDNLILSRVHYGLARIYDMKGDLEKAKEHYQAVSGGYAELAKMRIRQLEDPDVQKEIKEATDWLSTAVLPQRTSPNGPGTPGQQPEFSPGDLQMPESPGGGQPAASGIGDILNRVQTATDTDDENRYDAEDTAPSDEPAPDN